VYSAEARSCSGPRTNAVYRWHPSTRVSVFKPTIGYSGVDIGRLTLLPSHPTHLRMSRRANLSIRALAPRTSQYSAPTRASPMPPVL
jgi:hypothetical protein